MCLFSASKAITALLMHMLAEDGLVELARPVTGGFVLERVLRTVTGAGINTYIDRKIRPPMGMRYFTCGIRPATSSVPRRKFPRSSR